MTTVRAKVLDDGRIELPAEYRRLLGLEHGGDVLVRVEDGEIRIRTLMDSIREMQADMRRLLAGKNASVDDFLAERRRDAKRE